MSEIITKLSLKNFKYKAMKQFISFLKIFESGFKRDGMQQDDIPSHFLKKLIYFWLCWVFVAAHGLSLVAASGGYSSLRCAGFSLR